MRIKVLQWNIWYWEKINNIVQQIKATDPDVICLQEVSINGQANRNINAAEFIKKALSFYSYFKIAQHLNDDDDIGNSIFTRFPITSTSFHFLQKQSDKPPIDFAHEGRLYVEAQLDIHGFPLTVGTAHLSYTHQFEQTEAKEKEANNLLKILQSKNEKYIFTGDLNAPTDSYTVTEISKILTNCGPSNEELTWTTKPFDYQGFSVKTLDWRLDYVFATKDIKVVSSEIIKTEYSDHLPILVTLNI